LYDFNDCLAVFTSVSQAICSSAKVCTCSASACKLKLVVFDLRSKSPIVKDWISPTPSLVSVAVCKGYKWCTLSRLVLSIRDRNRTWPCRFQTFYGRAMTATLDFRLPLFPSDYAWAERKVPWVGPIDLVPSSDAETMGLVWRQPLPGWKVKGFEFNILTGEAVRSHAVVTCKDACFGERVFLSIQHRYLVLAHRELNPKEEPILEFSTLSGPTRLHRPPGANVVRVHPATRIALLKPTGKDQREYWVTCKDSCVRSYTRNERPADGLRFNGFSEFADIDANGDNQYVVTRRNSRLFVYGFGGCYN
jgi:hypothetical protein